MKKHTKKTLFSLFLTLVIIIGLMPSLAAYTFLELVCSLRAVGLSKIWVLP